ncbi:putative fibroblast growth factor 1 [Aplochiton taeniatus]
MLAHLGHCHMTVSQLQGHLPMMSEGEITVLPLGPSTIDLSRHRSLVRLYCMNGGHHLRILPDGTVIGGALENDLYDVLRVKAVSAGVVAIKGEETGRYLAMDKDGRVYGSKTFQDECYFVEKLAENHHNTYQSQKYNWYLGLKKNGKPKAGPRTDMSQNAIYFLPRPVNM